MKAPEKIAQKMTHDGAVAENLVTSEVERLSGREEETHFNPQEETVSFTEAAEQTAHSYTRHRERKAAKEDAETVREGSEARQRPSSRLQFTD
ncbi:MAG: peptidase M23, partial [Bacteroidaceae bacterium]|nr:peptidase M23 [Bacteroidaceae bacterium]